jgi:putative ABC transport system permease protein
VLNITLRNMQARARQFLIVIVGTALVFAMALLVTGLREAFKKEADTAISSIGGDAWVVPVGKEGPFTEFYDMGRASVEELRAVPGVRRADAVSLLPVAIHKGSDVKILTVVGHELRGLGEPLRMRAAAHVSRVRSWPTGPSGFTSVRRSRSRDTGSRRSDW